MCFKGYDTGCIPSVLPSLMSFGCSNLKSWPLLPNSSFVAAYQWPGSCYGHANDQHVWWLVNAVLEWLDPCSWHVWQVGSQVKHALLSSIPVCFNDCVFYMCYHLNMAIIGGLLSFSTTLFDIHPCWTVSSDLLHPLCSGSPVIRLNVLSLQLLSLVLPWGPIQRQMKAGHFVVGCTTELQYFLHSFKSLFKKQP